MPEQQPNQTQGDVDAKLKGLERLRLSGLITEERYETMRSQLLAAASQAMAAPPPPPQPAAEPPASAAASSFERYTPQAPRAETPASTTYQLPPLPPSIPAAPTLPTPAEAGPPPLAPTPAPPPASAAPTPPPPPAAAAPTPTPPTQPAGYHSTYHSAFPSGPPSTVPRYVPPDQRQPEPAPAPPPPVAPDYPPPVIPTWGSPPPRPAAPSARNRSLILAGLGAVILLAAGGVGALVLTGHSTSSSPSSSTIPSEAPVSTPVPTAVPKAIRDAYLAAVDPLGQSWVALDKAFKTAESKPCGSCPPGTFDLTPVIPALRDVYLAYRGSIDELGVIEARLDGQVQSDVGGLITSERRALVAFENALTTTNSTLDTAGALTRSNDEIQKLDNVVRKDMGLTPAPPVT
jgi:hypothetical protein